MEQDRRYLRTQMQKENIIQKLKERGCRITKQRLMLLDIILEEDCSCCKEIYYKASRLDDKIGTATVYRMVNTLEEIGAISRICTALPAIRTARWKMHVRSNLTTTRLWSSPAASGIRSSSQDFWHVAI